MSKFIAVDVTMKPSQGLAASRHHITPNAIDKTSLLVPIGGTLNKHDLVDPKLTLKRMNESRRSLVHVIINLGKIVQKNHNHFALLPIQF